jgi:CheY-like chemotaxis protein
MTDVNMPGDGRFQLTARVNARPFAQRDESDPDAHVGDGRATRPAAGSWRVGPLDEAGQAVGLFDAIVGSRRTVMDEGAGEAVASRQSGETRAEGAERAAGGGQCVNQRLAVGVLEKNGHRVVVANNGHEASPIGRATFDLILMDVQMPEMDGHQATARSEKRMRPDGGHTPIIAMTAHAMKGDRERMPGRRAWTDM